MSERRYRKLKQYAAACIDKKMLVRRYMDLSTEERKKEFLPVEQVAKKMELSTKTIRNWITEKKIVAIALGKKLVVYMPSLNQYVEEIQDQEVEEI